MPETNKRLVICCDGTWNSPEQHHVTNVVRTARALRPVDDQGVPQVVFYDWGIGSYGDRIRGGMLGTGIDKNIQDAYRFLVHNYSHRDEIFLFGFSRGAYTARSLAGLIRNAGVLKKIHADRIPAAYRMYRRRAGPDVPTALEFRREYSQEVRIRFVGVWDTVGALGVPSQIFEAMGGNRKYVFHDTSLSRIIENACHAVAIDEKRIDFEPTLWKQLPKDGQTIEQQWFAGVHGDVGGGNADPGLAHVALQWMWSRAAAHGLAFDDRYRNAKVRPDPLGKLHRSWTGMYRVKGRHVRPIGKLLPGMETVHDSVRERCVGMQGYRPANLVRFLSGNPQPDWPVDWPPAAE